ncbi:hypothetical protein EWB00_005168 [Schistosoma japonicum]|uniref:Uncharacterized protein n=1 Tax=Schistosoma japonicum TaxID=6182 RepID=A0A4Z2D3N5_SCHJA|nr:hypothetical protein EWB00_005168 [Schistosoma japonicum]
MDRYSNQQLVGDFVKLIYGQHFNYSTSPFFHLLQDVHCASLTNERKNNQDLEQLDESYRSGLATYGLIMTGAPPAKTSSTNLSETSCQASYCDR